MNKKKGYFHKNLVSSRRYTAFTLAEVLITLGIIGVVAALTIPTVIQNAQEKSIITALKKEYSTLSSAYSLAVQESGTPDEWGLTADLNGADKMLSYIRPYLKVTKKCNIGDGSCFPNEMYKYLQGTDYSNIYSSGLGSVVLSDGSILYTEVHDVSCLSNRGSTQALGNVCGTAWIDVNGYKKPNTLGIDFMGIYITKYGLIPRGSASETSGLEFDSSCKTMFQGYGCAAWVIYNENMGYLHCSDLSWTGKNKCS